MNGDTTAAITTVDTVDNKRRSVRSPTPVRLDEPLAGRGTAAETNDGDEVRTLLQVLRKLEKLGVTHERFADDAGLSPQYLSMLVKGTRTNPSSEKLIGIKAAAKKYGVLITIDDLKTYSRPSRPRPRWQRARRAKRAAQQ